MSMLVKEPITPQSASTDQPPVNGTNGHSPALESGDRLTRAEFERRYKAHPEIKKAELIEGVVYVAAPVRVNQHGVPHSRITGWLGVYQAATPGLNIADNATLRLDLDNEPQPDVAVWLDAGGAMVTMDDYLAGAPELIVEIASSSVALDLHAKLHAYRRNGVQEYLVILPQEARMRWFCWQDGETTELQPDAEGILKSRVLPGLWLAAQPFWQGDLAGLLAVLQQGIASAEHQAFVGGATAAQSPL